MCYQRVLRVYFVPVLVSMEINRRHYFWSNPRNFYWEMHINTGRNASHPRYDPIHEWLKLQKIFTSVPSTWDSSPENFCLSLLFCFPSDQWRCKWMTLCTILLEFSTFSIPT